MLDVARPVDRKALYVDAFFVDMTRLVIVFPRHIVASACRQDVDVPERSQAPREFKAIHFSAAENLSTAARNDESDFGFRQLPVRRSRRLGRDTERFTVAPEHAFRSSEFKVMHSSELTEIAKLLRVRAIDGRERRDPLCR